MKQIKPRKQVEPDRIDHAEHRLVEAGIDVISKTNKKLTFEYKGSLVTLWPYKGWFSGKTVKDGRGLENLLKQL